MSGWGDGQQLVALEGGRLALVDLPIPDVHVCRWVGSGAKLTRPRKDNAVSGGMG